MKLSRNLFPVLLLSLTSCNLYGGLDNPSNDAQLIEAARACLDSGDYVCAREYYQRISNTYTDIRVSELGFTVMAENQVFSIADLISSLGSNRGGSNTFLLLAETIASRGKTGGTISSVLQSTYSTYSTINDTQLQAFMQFLTSLATFNQVLASAVGADGVLTASDIVANPSTCQASNCTLAPDCDNPAGGGLSDTTNDVTTLGSATGWDTSASIGKLISAADAANQALGNLGGSSSFSGLLDTMREIDQLFGGAGAPAACKRQALQSVLFSN